MTPKEKAEELFWKYRPIIAGKQFVTDLVLMTEAKELTKQCALIAVDEILNIKPNNPFIVNGYYKAPIQYWREVKQEIEKL
jgi:hypothetical protein